ncbi:DoxX family protein [Peredibacter sp. HCB2-198]|uniref:DoxX family protein n=1 Tax=Peredibacter sp. HCB2-198 TaxID=3383025 RepID=UPI0038B4A778
MKALLFKAVPEKCNVHELSMFVPRVFFGLTMAFSHGLGKVPPPDMLVGGIESMGLPMPIVFAWLAALSEFAGGVLLALGLLTRPAALFLSITMAMAGLIVHMKDPFNVKEMAFLYLAVFIMFAIRGSGKWSVDYLISRK